MKILVDLSYIHSINKLNESVSLYAFRFLKSLPQKQRTDITLLVIKSMKHAIIERTGKYECVYFRDIMRPFSRIPYLKGFLRKFNWQKELSKFSLEKYQCVYIPFCWSGNAGYIKQKKIITIHDLRPMRQTSRAFSKTLIFKYLGLNKLYLKIIKRYYTSHIKNATNIIAISNHVHEDISNEWPIYTNKVTTIYNSVSRNNAKSIEIPALTNKRFILYVNTLTKYKNVITLIDAFNLLKSNVEFKDITLVIVGKKTTYWEKEISPNLISNNLINSIIHIDYAQTGELIWLYQNASIFVTPSIYEGFGYTPIEAALYECPVISSRCESLPDVTAEKVKYYDPATSSVALFNVIKEVFEKPISKTELENVRKFFEFRYSEKTQQKKILDLLMK